MNWDAQSVMVEGVACANRCAFIEASYELLETTSGGGPCGSEEATLESADGQGQGPESQGGPAAAPQTAHTLAAGSLLKVQAIQIHGRVPRTDAAGAVAAGLTAAPIDLPNPHVSQLTLP